MGAEALCATMNAKDDHATICWEFNSQEGCTKGKDCRFSHRYLVKEGKHPWTGKKLVGFVERYTNDPHCMNDDKILRGQAPVDGQEARRLRRAIHERPALYE